jgi:hypothetical protein
MISLENKVDKEGIEGSVVMADNEAASSGEATGRSRIKNEPKRPLQLELGISKSLAAMGLAHYSTNARSLPTILLLLLLMVIDLKRL